MGGAPSACKSVSRARHCCSRNTQTQARHESVPRDETFASRNVVPQERVKRRPSSNDRISFLQSKMAWKGEVSAGFGKTGFIECAAEMGMPYCMLGRLDNVRPHSLPSAGGGRMPRPSLINLARSILELWNKGIVCALLALMVAVPMRRGMSILAVWSISRAKGP